MALLEEHEEGVAFVCTESAALAFVITLYEPSILTVGIALPAITLTTAVAAPDCPRKLRRLRVNVIVPATSRLLGMRTGADSKCVVFGSRARIADVFAVPEVEENVHDTTM